MTLKELLDQIGALVAEGRIHAGTDVAIETSALTATCRGVRIAANGALLLRRTAQAPEQRPHRPVRAIPAQRRAESALSRQNFPWPDPSTYPTHEELDSWRAQLNPIVDAITRIRPEDTPLGGAMLIERACRES